jgi:hypothetical protein
MATIPALALFLHAFMRYVYNYDVKGDRVRVVLFRLIPWMTIRIADIREVEECYPLELWKLTPVLKFGNRLWGDCVLIRKKRGLIRSIVITPDNAHEFVEQVREIERQQLRTTGNTPYTLTAPRCSAFVSYFNEFGSVIRS